MYTVHDYNVIYNYAVHSIICEDWHFIHMQKTFALRRKVWVHKTNLIPSLFIEVPAPCMESERSCMCVRGVEFTPFLWFSIRFSSVFVVQSFTFLWRLPFASCHESFDRPDHIYMGSRDRDNMGHRTKTKEKNPPTTKTMSI